MSELSKQILNEGYTIFIRINHLGLNGTYLKYFKDGIYPQQLPQEELASIRILPHLMEVLKNGSIIQIHQPNYMITASLGIEKTEGEQDSTKYLELHNEYKGVELNTILINMETDLSHQSKEKTNDVKEYKKLYKGENKYE